MSMFLWTTVVEIDTVKCVFPVIISISYGNLNTDQNASFSAKSLIFLTIKTNHTTGTGTLGRGGEGRGGREEEEGREGGGETILSVGK